MATKLNCLHFFHSYDGGALNRIQLIRIDHSSFASENNFICESYLRNLGLTQIMFIVPWSKDYYSAWYSVRCSTYHLRVHLFKS